jgi:hypothetical protein
MKAEWMKVKEVCYGRSTSRSGFLGAVFGTPSTRSPPARQATLTLFLHVLQLDANSTGNPRENAEGGASAQGTKRHVSTSGGIESSYSLQSASVTKLLRSDLYAS